MEDNSENIESIFELIKDIKKNNEEIKEKNLDSDIINKINEKTCGENEKKNYFIIKHSPFYIVDKEPIEELLEELNYNDLESELDEINDEEFKKKLEANYKELLKDNLPMLYLYKTCTLPEVIFAKILKYC